MAISLSNNINNSKSLFSKSINPSHTKLLIKEGFDHSEINEINKKIETINSSIFNIGNSVLDVAKNLSEIKSLIKNNNWVKLTDSRIFYLSGRNCRDLASAYESWLFETNIPEIILAQISARSLAKIGNFDLVKRKDIIDRLLDGEIFTESDLKNFSSTKQTLNFDYNLQIKKAMDICHSLTDYQKLRNFQNIMIINVKQKEEILYLKNTISELKKNENK